MLVAVLGILAGLAATPVDARLAAYVANPGGATVSVIDTATNTVVATINIGTAPTNEPSAVAVTPDGTHAYVAVGNRDDQLGGNVAVIETATNTVVATIDGMAEATPTGVAITPDGSRAYVTNAGEPDVSDSGVSVIDTATNTVIATVDVGDPPIGVAVTPDGSRAYVTNGNEKVSVIDTATNSVVATVTVADFPWGVAFTPDGSRAYVTTRTATVCR